MEPVFKSNDGVSLTSIDDFKSVPLFLQNPNAIDIYQNTSSTMHPLLSSHNVAYSGFNHFGNVAHPVQSNFADLEVAAEGYAYTAAPSNHSFIQQTSMSAACAIPKRDNEPRPFPNTMPSKIFSERYFLSNGQKSWKRFRYLCVKFFHRWKRKYIFQQQTVSTCRNNWPTAIVPKVHSMT